MMLVFRAFLTSAKWDLPPNTELNITFCDADGRLSKTAVAEHPNGNELAEVLVQGLDCEVLSWKMNDHEPTAAEVISSAFNTGHELALRTTDITALKVLTGAIIAEASADVAQRVAFQTVRDKVRHTLHAAADDPDLPDLFNFLINAGVGKNSYIDDLLEFTSTFADSKIRQLRYSAFAVPNKMTGRVFWTKMAIIKRSYRKSPTLGYCPNPENAWVSFPLTHVLSLEALLRFFHVTCKANFEKVVVKWKQPLMANIDISATSAFFMAAAKKNDLRTIQQRMLAATVDFLEPLGLKPMDHPKSDCDWIDFSSIELEKATAVADAPKGTTETNCAIGVMRYDEATGDVLNKQVEFPQHKENKEKEKPVELPWRDWHRTHLAMGSLEADKCAAVLLLQGIYENYDVSTQPIQVMHIENRTWVVASENIEASTIMLPLCIPRHSKVFDVSVHPSPLAVTMQVLRHTREQVAGGAPQVLRHKTLFLHPEFKAPSRKKKKTAVAAVPPKAPEPKSAAPKANTRARGKGPVQPDPAVAAVPPKAPEPDPAVAELPSDAVAWEWGWWWWWWWSLFLFFVSISRTRTDEQVKYSQGPSQLSTFRSIS